MFFLHITWFWARACVVRNGYTGNIPTISVGKYALERQHSIYFPCWNKIMDYPNFLTVSYESLKASVEIFSKTFKCIYYDCYFVRTNVQYRRSFKWCSTYCYYTWTSFSDLDENIDFSSGLYSLILLKFFILHLTDFVAADGSAIADDAEDIPKDRSDFYRLSLLWTDYVMITLFLEQIPHPLIWGA